MQVALFVLCGLYTLSELDHFSLAENTTSMLFMGPVLSEAVLP